MKSTLRGLPGVSEAHLNLSNHRLQVRWADSQLALSSLLKTLRKIGYAAHPWQADAAAEQLQRENRRAMRELGVAGLLWMQVMMATMATWPEFNIDLSPELDKILRWVSLFLTTPIVFYCCGQFFRGALRDLRTRHLTMDVSVSLAIGGAYVAGIWSTITGQGELYFDAVGMFALFLWPDATLSAAPANVRRRRPRSWSTCCRPPACAWMRRGRASAFCSASCMSAIRYWCRQAPCCLPMDVLYRASRAWMNHC